MTTLKIINIEGIGSTYAKKLESIGIKNSNILLKKGRTPKGRKEIADQSEISGDLILRWVNLSDLIRIKGVGEEYSDLLEASGVDTVVELANRNAENLQKKMLEVNGEKKLVRRPPRLKDVEDWVSQAKTLPRRVEYTTEKELTPEETYPELESKIAKLEARLAKLSTNIETKPAEPKPAQIKPPEPKKDTLPKETEKKPAEVPKPAEKAKQLPATFNEALENAYYAAPMTDFHKYRASVTGYSPAPNRYFVRHTAPVGKVPTTNWNDQKASVTGYTQPSNQYFATRQRLAYHPADKTFGSFSGVKMTVDGVTIQEKKAETPKEAPKPKGTLPKGF
ncbi:MAG: DUF4332 domain-containing protein [Nitrosopumilus sp.]|nr:DUF4332 domain-containing protein [Nitrosopumilus sp.]